MKSSRKIPLAAEPWRSSRSRRGFKRETFEGSTQLIPELEIFGWLRFQTSLPGGLKPDRHPGAFEIHYMVRGHVRWWVGGKQFEFSTGRVFIIHPGEEHSGVDGVLQPCEHYWLRVKFPAHGAMALLTEAETSALREACEDMKYRTFKASPEVNEFFAKLLEEHRNGPTAHSLPMARALLHTLLITIVRDHDQYCLASRQKPLVTWRVRRTLDWLENQLHKSDISLDSVAQDVGLRPDGLRARFKAETGFTLHEYFLRRRVEEARLRLVESTDGILTIAMELGFSSSQYFATAFRQQTGETPSHYRRSNLQARVGLATPAIPSNAEIRRIGEISKPGLSVSPRFGKNSEKRKQLG